MRKADRAQASEHDWALPEDLGLDSKQIRQAFSVLDRFVAEERVPGIVALIGDSDEMMEPYAVGWASLQPERVPMTPDTIFDMASVTKVVTTTTAVLQLLEEGVWRLDDPVSRFWPAFPAGVTLRHLLTHTSGLPAWLPVHAHGEGPAAYREFLEQVPLAHEPGTRVVYSCLGYLVLGALVEELTQQSLDAYCSERIFKPLAMETSMFNPPAHLHQRCAATEVRAGHDAPTLGVVHDENARGRGGVAGNAGLFSTAYDMGRFCQAMLNGGTLGGRRILSGITVELAVKDHTPHLNESRGLGWVVKGERTHSSAGDLLSSQAFGHTGFTGTSIWIDPVNDLFIVLLTNRVHPTRENSSHIRLRPLFHNAVAAAL